MKLSRFKIQQMIDAGGVNIGARRSGGGGAGGGGGVSAQWVEEHYINKEFFSALFKILNGQGSSATEIEPNDKETIDNNPNTVNIKAMFDLWTEKNVSAMGYGSNRSAQSRGANNDPQQEIEDLKKENAELKDRLERIEKLLEITNDEK